jgi:hypothetical protein
MTKQANPEIFIVLDCVHQVPEWVYNTVLKLAQAFIPHMLPGHRYMLETICGNAFWDNQTTWRRAMAGMCMAHMVANDLLRLEFAETGGKRTKQYQRR